MDVPDRILYGLRRLSSGASVRGVTSGQAARISTPGAVKSGLRISEVTGFGPLDENETTTGARVSVTSVVLLMVAVGFLSRT